MRKIEKIMISNNTMEKKNFFAPLFLGLGATRRAAVLLLVMLLTTATAWAQSTETLGGYTFTIGTDGDGQYYIVDCEAALRALSSYSTSNSCSGKRFVQTADITLTGTFAPIGGNSSSNHDSFKGTYDGGGHTISGLQVQVTSSDFSSACAGLFSEVLTNGVVRNVGLIAPSVSCSCSGKGCRAGAIAGYVEYGTITNCFVLNPGTIMASNGSENYTGLFIGQKSGGTYANLYYYGTTALPMCGGKYDLGSNHIERIYKVTAGSNAGLPTRATTEGFIAQGSHYYREGATVQLSYTGSNPNSYRPVYSVSPTNTGASVTEQGVLTMGNGDITITATLSNIPLINISTGTIADIADQAYTGSAIVPDITLTVGGKVLTAGSDYLVSCTNNVNVGTATLTATGQGNYTGTLTKNFRIYYADMTGSCGTNVTYTLHDEDQNGHYEQLIISGTGAMTDFNDPDDVPWAAYLDDITSVIVQSGVTHIGAFAFYLCRNLTSVSLSEGLTSIGLSAFKYCYRLSALTVPASVESVGSNSFESLALSVSGGTLTFASGSRLTSVGNDAFYYAHASVDMSACTRLTAVPVAFQNFDKDVTFPHSLTSIAAKCFKGNNSKDAKVYVHVPDNYVLTVNDETISATNGKADITSAIGVGQNHAAVTLSCTPDPAHFSVNGDGSYTIHTATGWNVFCDCLDDNDTYNRFSGKTVKLGNDIGTAQDPITRMAGSSKHDFCGTFDGQGHTLTVKISSDSRDYTAPFSYVSTTKADPNDQADSPAAIRNLNVAGTVTATKDYAGGIVGAFWGTLTIENCTSSVAISTDNKHAAGFISCARGNATLRNCLSSVTINSTVSGDGTHAGFIGGSSNGVTTKIEGCAFTGSMLTTNGTTHCAGFVGYNSGTLTITNSLYAPADDETWVSSDGSATFARGNAPTTTNTYYTQTLGDAQGKACHSITAGENVTIDGLGAGTEYSVSGITAYPTGIKYNDVYYAGSGDEVSLTLSNSSAPAPEGYQYGYSASAGTLDGTTLTMPDGDVTITAALSVIDWATESDGDADHPYMIYNKDQLDLLAQRVNGTHGETRQEDGYSGKYFKLANDINYPHSSDWNNFTSDENNFEAIGGNNYNCHFRGHFDGNNKTISGIRIYKNDNGIADNYKGIFGRTAIGADIHDLTLADARITGYLDIGGIVGYNNKSTVNRCHVAANVAICAVQPNVSSLGGIVGANDNRGTIENCISAATLTVADADKSNYYGGIAGTNRQYSTLHNNLVIGATVPAVKANSYGAITGFNRNSTFEHNYYAACKVANVWNTTGVGCGSFGSSPDYFIADATEDDGAVPALRDGADNTYALSLFAAIPATLDLGWGAGKYSVQLTGRTLYKDGDWNTLCLPFAMTAEQVAASALAGATLMELDTDAGSYGHVTGLDNGTLYLNFKDATSIKAGKPYLIKWAKANDYVDDNAHNIVNPVFSGVTIDNTASTEVAFTGGTFKGTYSPIVWDTENKSILFVGTNNTLYWPTAGGHVNACRAYFDLGSASAREFVMNFDGENEVTSLPQPLQKEGSQADAWYTLDGRKLNGKPTTKGLYIHNGKKVIIK